MHGYNEFFEDVTNAFRELITEQKGVIKFFSDKNFGNYAVEIVFDKSKIILDLDRMDLQAKIENPIDSKQYHVGSILDALNQKLNYTTPNNIESQTREYIIENLKLYNFIIKNYLIDVIKGNFELSQQYDKNERVTKEMVKKVMELPSTDPISQKFWSGDDTWKEDIVIRLKN